MADQTVQPQFSALGGRVIEIGLTTKPVTAWGGMAVFAAFAESVGLRRLVERSLNGLVRTSPNALPAADLLLGFMVGVLTGASRMLHLERLRADSALRSMFGLTRFVAPTTYARFFQALRGQLQVHFWETVTAWTLDRLPARPLGYTLDIDSTVIERFGEQDGALCGYNPRRRGGPTHHPLLAGLAEVRILVHAWLRGGNTASGNNAVAFLQECLGLLQGHVKLRMLRADNGFFDNRILSFLESVGLPYLVKARFTRLVKLAAEQVGEWTVLGKGIEVAEARIRLLRWDTERRLVLIRHRVPEREKPQGKRLFTFEEHRYQAIVTSFPPAEMDAASVYRNYLPRGEFENRIKELKAGCGLTGFCLDAFHATEALLRVLCFTHNLVQLFQDGLGLRKADRPWREGPRYTLETLRNTLFTCAATLGARGRQSILRLSTTPAWWHHFHQALARFLPNLHNCRSIPAPRSFGPSQPPLLLE
jgi:hypothetical protein